MLDDTAYVAASLTLELCSEVMLAKRPCSVSFSEGMRTPSEVRASVTFFAAVASAWAALALFSAISTATELASDSAPRSTNSFSSGLSTLARNTLNELP